MEELIAVYPSRETVIRSEVDWDHLNSPETMEDFFRNRLFDGNLAQEFINNQHDRVHQIPNILKNHSPFSQGFTDIDFVNNRFIADRINHPNFASVPGLQASGGVNGTTITDGQIVAATAPRISDDGLIIEGEATNYFLNNSEFDQVPLGSVTTNNTDLPGVVFSGSLSGVNVEVVGRGTDPDTGLPYMDVKWSGTNGASSTRFYSIFNQVTDPSTASPGEAFNSSGYFKRVAGSVTSGVEFGLLMSFNRANNSIINTVFHQIQSLVTTDMARYNVNDTAPAETAKLGTRGFRLTVSAGSSVDITLRIAGIQITDTDHPESLIFTDNNGNVTRTADNIRFNDLPILGLDQSVLGKAYSVYWQGFAESDIADTTRTMWQLDDGTDNNRSRARFDNTSAVIGEAVDNGVVQGSVAVGSSPSARTSIKHAMRFKADDFAAVVDGGTVITDTSGSLEEGLTELRIGRTASGNPLNGTLQRLLILPEMTDEQLKAITG